MIHDNQAISDTYDNPDKAVPWVLMASYLYYHCDINLLSDGCYDDLTKIVRSEWGTITHRHKHLLECLLEQTTSSLFHLKVKDYPDICRSAACRLAEIKFAKEDQDIYNPGKKRAKKPVTKTTAEVKPSQEES